MKAASLHSRRGFTVLELMVASAIFLVLCAAMFGLLQLSQQKYTNETHLSGAFQETRLAIDQIVRDFNVAGYPSVALFSNPPADSSKYAITPVAWDPNYGILPPPCLVGTAGGGTCATPGDFDLIVEADLGSGVNWIRYQLIGTTLYRSVVPKSLGAIPIAVTATPDVMVPFLTNVMNNAAAAVPAQFAQITAEYPTMFPGGAQPVFQYTCDTPAGPQPCPLAGNYGVPTNIRDVNITLIVLTVQPDVQTQELKLVELSGRGHRVNPTN